MSDANESVPPLIQSEDSEPFNPFAELCDGSPEVHLNKPKFERTALGSQQSQRQPDQGQNSQSTWKPDYNVQPPPPPPPPSHSKASNPQEDAQMQQEMSWEVGKSYTEEEMNQMAEEMSWEVPESRLVDHLGRLGKPFVEQGFISDKST
eukprot:2690827-Karenia_brevis.AAC.1